MEKIYINHKEMDIKRNMNKKDIYKKDIHINER